MIRFSGSDPWDDLTAHEQQVNWLRVEVREVAPLQVCAECGGSGRESGMYAQPCFTCQGDGAIEQPGEAP